ncbi:MAG TPA: hypothetical protein VIJ03_05985 [Candidatus Dormibacteraeota bacterium]
MVASATREPDHAVNAPASAGPAPIVTAYAMLSKALARSQSCLGTTRGKSERAPLLLSEKVSALTVTIGNRTTG